MEEEALKGPSTPSLRKNAGRGRPLDADGTAPLPAGFESGAQLRAELGWHRGPTDRPERDGRFALGGIVVTKTSPFTPVGSSVDLPELEHGVLELWERERS